MAFVSARVAERDIYMAGKPLLKLSSPGSNPVITATISNQRLSQARGGPRIESRARVFFFKFFLNYLIYFFMKSGIGLSGMVFLVFLILKLAEIGQVANWSWWWVTCPLWGDVALILAVLIIAVALTLIFKK